MNEVFIKTFAIRLSMVLSIDEVRNYIYDIRITTYKGIRYPLAETLN